MGAPDFLIILIRRLDVRRFYWPGLIIGTVLIWAAIFSFPRSSQLLLKFYDVGEGDAIFIKTEEGKKVLIDGGPDGKVVNYLSRDLPFYDRTLDLIIVTHPHADHLRGIVEVLKRYSVQHVLYNPGAYTEQVYRDFEREIKDQKIPTWPGKAGDTITLDSSSHLLVLWPHRNGDVSASINPNEDSIILLLQNKSFSALLTDDAEKSVQDGISWPVSDDDLEVLKVPHHGARTALDEAFIARVSPKVAIISVGKNSYGHPAAEVLGAYSIRNIPLLRTDTSGSISLTTDGVDWGYWTEK